MTSNVSVQGTVFWLIVSAILIVGCSIAMDMMMLAVGLITAVVYLIVGVFAWKEKRWSFIAAILLALYTIAGNVVFLQLNYASHLVTFLISSLPSGFITTDAFEILSALGFILIPQLLLIFYSLRAYFDVKAS